MHCPGNPIIQKKIANGSYLRFFLRKKNIFLMSSYLGNIQKLWHGNKHMNGQNVDGWALELLVNPESSVKIN